MQRQMLQQLFLGRPAWVVWNAGYSNLILFNVCNLHIPRFQTRRLSLDLSCCIFLRVLNATQTVLIEGWS